MTLRVRLGLEPAPVPTADLWGEIGRLHRELNQAQQEIEHLRKVRRYAMRRISSITQLNEAHLNEHGCSCK